MPTIKDNGANPMLIVSRHEVQEWLRKLADDAGYADRETCAFQLSVETKFYAENYHHAAPELLIMVSNIPNSRQK